MTGLTRESPATHASASSDEGQRRSDTASEPWDERPRPSSRTSGSVDNNSHSNSHNSNTMRGRDAYGMDEQELEDGDLPPLNLSRSGERHRNSNSSNSHNKPAGRRFTPSPLAGSSITGPPQLLDSELKKQREFWKQLDAPSVSNDGGSKQARSRRNFDQSDDDDYEEEEDDDDHPEDELTARRHEAREDSRKDPFRPKKVVDAKPRVERTRRGAADTDDSDDSREYVVEQEETNFCDHTLSAMEAICGESAIQTFCGGAVGNGTDGNNNNNNNNNRDGKNYKSNPNHAGTTRKARNLNILNARNDTDSVDEHTAIEVEYVEPEDIHGVAQGKPENWSPSRKNAYLAAMARKAKEDYEKSQAREVASVASSNQPSNVHPSSPTGSMTAAANNQVRSPTNHSPAGEDVYNSFNAAEKRKFLRLINSGMTPSESAQRIRMERDNSNKNKETTTNNKQSKKGKLFKFWKKGGGGAGSKSKTPSPPQDKSHAGGFSVGSHPQEEKKEDDHRLVQDRRASPPSVEEDGSTDGNLTRERSLESQSQSQSQSVSEDSHHKDSGTSENTNETERNYVAVDKQEDRRENSASPPRPKEETSADRTLPDPAGESPNNTSSNHQGTPNRTDPFGTVSGALDNSAAFDERFAKSGINYYDAVRRELSESDDETTFSNNNSVASAKNRSHRTAILGPILQSPKLKGFSRLSKGQMDELEEERNEDEEPVASSLESTRLSKPAPIVTPDTSSLRAAQIVGVDPLTREEEKTEIDANFPDKDDYTLTQGRSSTFDNSLTEDNKSQEAETPSPAEEEALGKIEKELLRPVAKYTGPALSTPTHKVSQPFVVSPESSVGAGNSVSASKMTQKANYNQNAAIVSPTSLEENTDFNMQEYMNSTEVYSQSAYVNDSMSVTSGKSFSTVETGLGPGSVYTQSSILTQSSRKRRPGAAKTRLAKAKEAEKQARKKGWHESIRAAAETTNRVWKPKVGWVDYQEPTHEDNTADLSTSNISSEKIHLNLSLGKPSKHAEKGDLEGEDHDGHQEEDAQDNTSHVPFPSEWEKERAAMVNEGSSTVRSPIIFNKESAPPVNEDSVTVSSPTVSKESSTVNVNKETSTVGSPTVNKESSTVRSPVANKEPSPSARTRMFNEESATANDETSTVRSPMVNDESSADQHHKTNDSLCLSVDDLSVEQSVAHSVEQFVQSVSASSPTKPSRRRTAASPLRAQRMPSSPSKRSGWVDSMRAATANIGNEGQSWDPMNGWANVDVVSPEALNDFSPPSARYEQETIEERTSERFDYESQSSSNPATDLAVSNVIAKQEPSAEICQRPDSNISTEAPVRQLKLWGGSGVLDKWTSKEYKGNKNRESRVGPSAIDYNGYSHQAGGDDDDEAPLLDTTDDFHDETLNMTPTVNVVKEKVDEEDISWFPQTRRGSASSNSWLEKQGKEQAFASAQRSVASSSKSPSRRSRGPVDVDEADNLSDNSEDEQEERGVLFNGVVFETESHPETVTKRASVSSPMSASSVTSRTSFSKVVPKLSQSRRDTSPIRAGKAYESAGAPWTDNTTKADVAANFDPSKGIFEVQETRLTHQYEQHHSQAPQIGVSAIEESRPIKIDPVGDRRTEIQSAVQAMDIHNNKDDSSQSPSASSSYVKLRAQEWEKRVPTGDRHRPTGNGSRLNSATAEWKSFLGKKVRAESAAAAEHRRKGDGEKPKVSYAVEQADSLFEFSVTDGTSDVSSPSRGAGNNRAENTREMPLQNAQNNIPTAKEVPVSEGSDYSDGNEINKTFLGRLATCAAPIKRMQNDGLAHLAFLRTNPQDGKNGSARFMPQYLCGRPDVILEEDGEGDEPGREVGASASEEKTQKSTDIHSNKDAKPMSNQQLRDIKSNGGEVRADTRSVISEDFGAKTAYLEALAMKTAVSKPRKSDSRRRERSSASSDISSGTTKSHKEKWRDFLERKSKSGASPGKPRGNGSDASAAAESYAAKKVEEMMEMMARRSKSTPRNFRSNASVQYTDGDKSRVVEEMIREHTNSSPRHNVHDLSRHVIDNKNRGDYLSGAATDDFINTKHKKSDSMVAAEQLASARVNAMMQALAANSKSGTEEGEI